jgi:hypothetical protein
MGQTHRPMGEMHKASGGSTSRAIYFLVGDYHRLAMDNKAPDVDAIEYLSDLALKRYPANHRRPKS